MAHFALLWKARTIEKYRINYENEKYQSIMASNTELPQKSLSQRWRHYRCSTQKRISMTFRRLYPEGSSLYNFFLYFNAEQSCLSIVLKSLLGFSIGIVLTYLSFLFFVFQLSISLLHATIMSSVIGVLLTMGLAFSYRIRCLIFLLIPQFFSRAGRYTLTCYALVLILTGPATNTLKNSEVLSESMACQQEQMKTLVNEISHSAKKPYNLMKDSIKVIVERLRQFASEMKKTIVKVNRLILSILQVIQSAFSWLNALSDICNRNIGTPYERCKKAVEDGAKNCKERFGAKSQSLCNATDKVHAACRSFKPYNVICVFVDLINGSIVTTIRKRLKNFSRRIRSMLYLQIHIHHSYTFSGNASHSPSQVAAGIVTEIRKRADPILTWLSWSSCVTSLFLLLIIFRAKNYQHMFETRSRFDNRYITKEMRDLDLKRLRQGRETILPLNRRERSKYVTTTSFRLVASEKVYLTRSAVFMAITTFKLMIHMVADYSLYWVLTTIRYHGKLQTSLPFGPPNAGMHISGSGRIAELFRSMLEALTTSLEIPLPSHTACLPDPHPPDLQRYTQIGILIFLLWFFALFEPYGLRLRHVIMGHYRPERSKARAEWLYNHILRTRGGFMKFARRKLHRAFKYTTEEKYTFKVWLQDHIPFSCLRYFLGLQEDPRCLLCGTKEYIKDPNTQLQKCDTPRCIGTFCSSCFSDIGQLCTVCLSPKDYGDLSDVSLEKGSSDDSDDDSDDDTKQGRHNAEQEDYIEMHDVNEQTPMTKPNKEKKWRIFRMRDNNDGCSEQLPLLDIFYRYNKSNNFTSKKYLNSKRKANLFFKRGLKREGCSYNHNNNQENNNVQIAIIMLKNETTKAITYTRYQDLSESTETDLSMIKRCNCNHVIMYMNGTKMLHVKTNSTVFWICTLATMKTVDKNKNNESKCRVFKPHRALRLNFYDIDVNKKNIEVNKIVHTSVLIRCLPILKNKTAKNRKSIFNLNYKNINITNNRYFMTLNDELHADQNILNINGYNECDKNEISNNKKKSKRGNKPVKEIKKNSKKQNIENGTNEANPLKTRNKKTSCCFQTICYVYWQYIKCNKSTSCNTHKLKMSDVEKNHKRRKKHKNKTKTKIPSHKHNNEDTRNYRISAYLDEQDWMKRNTRNIDKDKNEKILHIANENETFDDNDDQNVKHKGIVCDNYQTKGTANMGLNYEVQNCDIKNLYLSKEQSIELKNYKNPSFDTKRRLAFYSHIGNPDFDQGYFKKHVGNYSTGVKFQKAAIPGHSGTNIKLEMPRHRESIEAEETKKETKEEEESDSCSFCGMRQRLHRFLDQLSKTASQSQTCIAKFVNKAVSIIPGDTCGEDCDGVGNIKGVETKKEKKEGEESDSSGFCGMPQRLHRFLEQLSKTASQPQTCIGNIVNKAVSIIPGDTCGEDCDGVGNIKVNEECVQCENHICTCKEFVGYELVKKISSHIRKYIKIMFKEKPETANKCANVPSCKRIESQELDKKISTHVKKYIKMMFTEGTKACKCDEKHKGQKKTAKTEATTTIKDSGCQCGSDLQGHCNSKLVQNKDKNDNKHTAIKIQTSGFANKHVSAAPDMRTCSCQYCIDDEASAEASYQPLLETPKEQKKKDEAANVVCDVPSCSSQCLQDPQESISSIKDLRGVFFKKKKRVKDKKDGKEKKKIKEKKKNKDSKKANKPSIRLQVPCNCQHELVDQPQEDCSKKEFCKLNTCKQIVKLNENQTTLRHDDRIEKKENVKQSKVGKGKYVESSYSADCACKQDTTDKKERKKAEKKRKSVYGKDGMNGITIHNKEATAAPLKQSCSCQKLLRPKLAHDKKIGTPKFTGIDASTQVASSYVCCTCGTSTFSVNKCTCASQYNAWDVPGNSNASKEDQHYNASILDSTCCISDESSTASRNTVTDTTICSLACIDHRMKKSPRVVTKSNRGTGMEKVNVCDVSTLTSDWWSPILEKKHDDGDKEMYLEKKHGDFIMHKNFGMKSRGISTGGKYVSFRSKAQLIPESPADIMSPARYLLESQKYYNELFLSKFYAPALYPVNINQKRQRNRSPIGSHSRRSHRTKRLEDTYSPRKQINSKKRAGDLMNVAEYKNQKLHKKKHRHDDRP